MIISHLTRISSISTRRLPMAHLPLRFTLPPEAKDSVSLDSFR